MFIKLLTFTGIWIAFGFAAGCAIWAGMALSRRQSGGARQQSAQDPLLMQPGRDDGGVTYRVLKGGSEAGTPGESHRPGSAERKLLNFPR